MSDTDRRLLLLVAGLVVSALVVALLSRRWQTARNGNWPAFAGTFCYFVGLWLTVAADIHAFFWDVAMAGVLGAVAYALALRTTLLKGALASAVTTLLVFGPVYADRILNSGRWT